MIEGHVRDGAGRPVAGARVMVASAPSPIADIAAVTDDQGWFVLPVEASGRYGVLIVDDVHPSSTVEVDVPPDGMTDLIVTI